MADKETLLILSVKSRKIELAQLLMKPALSYGVAASVLTPAFSRRDNSSNGVGGGSGRGGSGSGAGVTGTSGVSSGSGLGTAGGSFLPSLSKILALSCITVSEKSVQNGTGELMNSIFFELSFIVFKGRISSKKTFSIV